MEIVIAFFIGLFLGCFMVYFSALEHFRKANFYKNELEGANRYIEVLLLKDDDLKETIKRWERQYGVKM